jgi:hypothetical protein
MRYQNSIMDSERWDEITLREGDIVISTPRKCGTPWTEMICALLIFQTVELPQSLDDMSPWVDMLTPSRTELRAVYESKSHRRFFKTHTPLNGLPVDERVAYICVGRDPRDAAFSWLNHIANLNIEVVSELVEAAAAAESRPATSAQEHLKGIPPHAYPLEDFPDLYHDRWQIQTAIGEVETRLRGGADVVLRSRKPDLARQEVYGLLCLYQAIRHLIVAGAQHAGLDPDRISFTRARDAVARHVSDDAAFSPNCWLSSSTTSSTRSPTGATCSQPYPGYAASPANSDNPAAATHARKHEYKKPLPPRTKIRFWVLTSQDP